MSKHKPGDKLIGSLVGDIWTYVGELSGHAYLVREKEGEAADAIAFAARHVEGWKAAPEPFFEEGKRYRGKFSKRLMVVRAVHELIDGPVAVVEYEGGGAALFSEDSLEFWSPES